MDRISELPQVILQRILYLLPQEEAVRTSVLSKSWRYIWCTRPNFHISEKNFKGNKRKFLYVVNSTLQQYHDLKLCLDEFRLSISLGKNLYHESVSLLEKWIPLLTTVGVKEFHLSIGTEHQGCVKLPPVVFGAESLHYLHVEGFELDKKAIERIVLCKHLRSLSLVRVSIETIYPHPSLEAIKIICGDISFHKGSNFRNLSHLSLLSVKESLDHLSSCKFPSLKYLEISNCDGLKGTRLFIDAPNINHFIYTGSFVPYISFETTFNKWKSFIYLTYEHPNDAHSLWFLKLKKLLESLSQSEISLTFVQFDMNDVIQEHVVEQTIGCDKPVVERLSLYWQSSSILSHLNCALSICRPRIIGEYGFGWKRERAECLWKIVMQREIERAELSQWWFRDLAEVRMEIDKIDNINREEWQSITLSELQKYKETTNHRFRFVLKWRG